MKDYYTTGKSHLPHLYISQKVENVPIELGGERVADIFSMAVAESCGPIR